MDFEKIANSWNTYDYHKAVFEDAKEYLLDNMDSLVDADMESIEEIEEKANDDMWTADSVTGNGSGSYTFSRIIAELYLVNNGDLYEEALETFDDKFNAEAENRDVTIRCYLLGEAIGKALEDDDVIAKFNEVKAGLSNGTED